MKSLFRAIVKFRYRIREWTIRGNPPQCSCGFPAEYLVIDARGRKLWLCEFGFEEMIDVESGRNSRWNARRGS